MDFRTRKRDKQVFPLRKKSGRDSGTPSYVGVDKSQIEHKPKSMQDYVKHLDNPKLTPAQSKFISKEIRKQLKEGKPHKQAVAIAYSKARKKYGNMRLARNNPKKYLYEVEGKLFNPRTRELTITTRTVTAKNPEEARKKARKKGGIFRTSFTPSRVKAPRLISQK